MSESVSEPAAVPIYAQPWAVRLGFLVIAAFTLIAGLVAMDHGNRAQLEASAETTGVGDNALFVLPDPAKLPGVVATLDGKPLELAGAKALDLRDTHAHRVGRDAERGLSVYIVADTATDAEKARVGDNSVLLLKTAVNQYVTLRPQAK